MSKVTIDGVGIYCEVTGEGHPLVFLHEYAGSYESWRTQVAFFSGSYRVVTYNARGYPPSDVPRDPSAYSQQRAVQDLYGLLLHLNVDQAYLCGLSMGGNVALHFAFKHPSMVRGIVAAGTGSGSDDPEQLRQMVDEHAAQLETQGMEGVAYFTSVPTRAQLLRKDPGGWEAFHRLFLGQSALGSALTLRGVQGKRPSIFDLGPELRALKVPTLIMTGDEDGPCIQSSLYLKRHISTSGLLMFPQTGHTMNLEEPDLFNHSIQTFLTAVEEGRWAEHNPDDLAAFIIGPESDAKP